MNESLEVQASPGSLSSTNPRDTGPTASSTTESRQQPPMQSVSPVPDQSQIDSFRKERQRATTRQSAHPTTTTDSGEVHLFLCHRSPAANGLPQISSAYEGVFRNVEAAINHASQASIPADSPSSGGRASRLPARESGERAHPLPPDRVAAGPLPPAARCAWPGSGPGRPAPACRK